MNPLKNPDFTRTIIHGQDPHQINRISGSEADGIYIADD
jgi:hypothetical protein